MEKIKVTLTKSLIAAKPNLMGTAASLCLVMIGDSVIHEAGPVINGKIKVIAHLVSVEQA